MESGELRLSERCQRAKRLSIGLICQLLAGCLGLFGGVIGQFYGKLAAKGLLSRCNITASSIILIPGSCQQCLSERGVVPACLLSTYYFNDSIMTTDETLDKSFFSPPAAAQELSRTFCILCLRLVCRASVSHNLAFVCAEKRGILAL